MNSTVRSEFGRSDVGTFKLGWANPKSMVTLRDSSEIAQFPAAVTEVGRRKFRLFARSFRFSFNVPPPPWATDKLPVEATVIGAVLPLPAGF